MTPKSPMDRLLDRVAWEPLPEPANRDDQMPYATHSGELTIEGFGTLRVYRLNTGERIIHAGDLEAIFGIPEEE